MGSLFRSEEMRLVQLFVQLEAAHDTLDELGELGLIQFRDLNGEVSAFQRHFVLEVKRADEMERKLRVFETHIAKFLNQSSVLTIDSDNIPAPSPKDMNELEVHFERLEEEVQQLDTNREILIRNNNELIEMRHVLDESVHIFEESSSGLARASFEAVAPSGSVYEMEAMGEGRDVEAGMAFGGRLSNLGSVSGTLERSKVQNYERVLWRVLRGNVFLRTSDISQSVMDPKTGEMTEKVVFIVFVQGQRALAKAQKVSEAYGANLYPISDSAEERTTMRREIQVRIDDLEMVLESSRERMCEVLSGIQANLKAWKVLVAKEKSIYHTMNMFNYDVGRQCLIAEGWCPAKSQNDIQLALRRANERSGALVPSILRPVETNDTHPTYHETSEFTGCFQEIVDMYGVNRYREVNPGVFTIITFPFLFGVMFGDVGHGMILLLVALFLFYQRRKTPEGQQPSDAVLNRHLILFMALFSIYCGFLYNECFAVSMDIFGSRYYYDIPNIKADNFEAQVRPGKEAYAYPIGVDPIWKGSKNELDYFNSLKMKMSVIMGVTQMVLGICLSVFNARYFKKAYNLYFEFIPQILFMLSIFGYMVFLIIFKWLTNWEEASMEAPRLLNLIIEMCLMPMQLSEKFHIYPGQHAVQLVLLAIAAISVPWMLLPKPFLLRRDHLKSVGSGRRRFEMIQEDGAERENVIEEAEGSEEEEHEQFEFSEVMMHQVIHTIEFVLGCISNTASYLRLWALSLAHSELATVFFERLFKATLEPPLGQWWAIFIGFAAWAALTMGVLLGMESMSAVLHALRLHWVEFMNKFYAGDGHKFQPFCYRTLLSKMEAAEKEL